MTTGVFLLVGFGGLFWAAYRRPRRRRWLLPRPAWRAVGVAVRRPATGGVRPVGTPLELTRTKLTELLAEGRAEEVADVLRSGERFADRVRAAADIGGAAAGPMLERLLVRPPGRDPAEQARHRPAIAAALRRHGHEAALPAVLRCVSEASDGSLLAAEAVAFPNFGAALSDPKSPLGRHALSALTLTARAARLGPLDPASLVQLGAADHLAHVGETAPPTADPWVTAAVVEAERLFRRLGRWSRHFDDPTRAAADRQAVRLWESVDRRRRWLAEAPRRLRLRFPVSSGNERRAVLVCLTELRADVAALFPSLPDRRTTGWADAVRSLTHSTAVAHGPMLAGLARALLGGRAAAPTVVVLGALRGHGGEVVEAVLLKAAKSGDAAVRRAACGSLGWHDPVRTREVVAVLNGVRRDADPFTRKAAAAALARLGERAALREFADGLSGEEPAIRQAAALAVADEGLSWLWPDLDAVIDTGEPDVALSAVEAVARLHERAFGLT